MAVLIGLALVAAGAASSVAQVRWAARSGLAPLRMWHVSESLPARWRHLSDGGIAVLLVAGASTAGWSQPWWVQLLVIAAAAAVTAAAQALALRAGRARSVSVGS